MHFDGEYRLLGMIDPAPVRAAVTALSEARWAEQSGRQQVYKVHALTQTIPIVFDPDMRHQRPTIWPMFEQLESVLQPAMAVIEDHYAASAGAEDAPRGYFARIILTRLAAQGEIASHRDHGESLSRAHRVHLPIVTDPGVLFAIAGNIRHLPAGELWEINNRKAHAVRNRSETPRIHAIFDYVVPGERIADPDGVLIA